MAVSIVDAVVVKFLAYRTSFALFIGLLASMVQVLRVWEGIWAVADDGGAAEIPRRYCKFSSVCNLRSTRKVQHDMKFSPRIPVPPR